MLETQIQRLLTMHGIQLDADSFTNLIRLLRVPRLSFMVRALLGAALQILIGKLEGMYRDRALPAEAA